jgi:lipopolysaccharide/colanic/teichoic acid biosynthesis glycosyltransferase
MRFLTGSRIGSWQPAEAERLPFDGAPIIPASVAIGKRVFDIVFSVVILAVFALLVVPLALAIKLESPGPVFYRQRRVGRTTPEATYFFDLIKFRSMRQDAEAKSGPVLSAEKHDPRITRIGGFLRATRLDELPQCLNVLIGDMSVVGPRPERPAFFNRLEDDLPFYTERTFGLKPGLTGLAQVMQDYRSSITDINSKVAYDHAYALRLTSFWSWLKADVGILLMTVKVVLFPTGR